MGPGGIYRMGQCPVVDNTVGVRFLREVRIKLGWRVFFGIQ
jgi:hypothetical protein